MECIFVGYQLEKGAFRLVRIENRRMLISRCVTFDETILGFDTNESKKQLKYVQIPHANEDNSRFLDDTLNNDQHRLPDFTNAECPKSPEETNVEEP